MRPMRFQGNVHILNFPASTEPAELAELFDEFGVVLGAQIKTVGAADGGTVRLGIVAVAPDAAADKAIVALQGHKMGGFKLRMVRAKPPVKKPPGAKAQPAQRASRPAPTSAEQFPAPVAAAGPKKVIVEYRGRRARTTARVISLTDTD